MPETPKKNATGGEAATETSGQVVAEEVQENIFLFVPNLIGEYL